ncbi:MAG: tetratricopeptide repeat protein [Bacteroidota bacterium]
MKNTCVFLGLMLWLLSGDPAWAQNSSDSDYQYVLIEATKQKNLGNFAEALKLYKLVLENKPNCAVAAYETGNLYFSANQINSAEESFSIAYNLDRENVWYISAYANVLRLNNNLKESENILLKGCKTFPDNIDFQYMLASVYSDQGKGSKAVRILNRIQNKNGFSDKVTLLLSDIYVKEKKFDKALDELDRLISVFPEVPQFYVMSAEISEKAGLSERSVNYYLQAFGIDSSNIYAITNLADHYREVNDIEKSLYFLKYSFYSKEIDLKRKLSILSYYLMNDSLETIYAGAVDNLFTALKSTYPEEKDIALLEVDFNIDLEKYAKAFSVLKPVLFSEVVDYNVWLQGLSLASFAEKPEELLETVERAALLFPDSTVVNYYLSLAYYQNKDYDELIQTVCKTDLEDKRFPGLKIQMLTLKAEALNNLKRYAAADSVFLFLLDLDPDNVLLLNNYSYYLAERGENLEQALIWSGKTLDSDGKNSTYLDTYAWILFKLNRLEEAYTYIEKALGYGGFKDGDVVLHAGKIAESLGLLEKAKEFYNSALKLGVSNEDLLQRIDRLSDK